MAYCESLSLSLERAQVPQRGVHGAEGERGAHLWWGREQEHSQGEDQEEKQQALYGEAAAEDINFINF